MAHRRLQALAVGAAVAIGGLAWLVQAGSWNAAPASARAMWAAREHDAGALPVSPPRNWSTLRVAVRDRSAREPLDAAWVRLPGPARCEPLGGGAFRCFDVEVGARFEAGAIGHVTASRRLTGEETLVELERTATVHGRVVSVDGPLEGAIVSARPSLGETQVVVRAVSGPGGSFALEVPPGAWAVTASRGNESGSIPGFVTLSPGEEAELPEIVVSAPGAVLVRVDGYDRVAAGGEVATAMVRPAFGGTSTSRGLSADGTAELRDLTPGTYDVVVTARGHEGAVIREIAVRAGGTTVARLALSRLTDLSGFVLRADGREAKGCMVAVTSGEGPLSASLSIAVDAVGAFRFSGVRGVATRFQITCPRVAVGHVIAAELSDGLALRVPESVEVEGRVQLRAGRQDTVYVHLVAAATGAAGVLTADEGGFFRGTVFSGEYVLTPEAGGKRGEPVKVTLTPASSRAPDLLLR